MGVLGVSILFSGMVLIMNGVARFQKWDAKSIAFFNIVVGSIIAIINIVGMTKATGIGDYQNIASGLLFAITYLFIAANYLFKLDLRPFGWFCFFASIYALFNAITTFDSADPRMSMLWMAWVVLWLEGFLELSLGIKKLGQVLAKVFPYLSIAEGIFSTFMPALFMLLNKW